MRESASQSQRFWKMRVFSENEMCASLIEQRLFLFASAALASSAGTEAPDRTAAIERLREDDCSCAAGVSASARVWASRSGGTLRAPAPVWTPLRVMALSPAACEPLLFAAVPFLLLLLLLLLLAAGVPLGLELLLEFGTAFCSVYRSTNETSRFWTAETSRTHVRWIRKRALGVLQRICTNEKPEQMPLVNMTLINRIITNCSNIVLVLLCSLYSVRQERSSTAHVQWQKFYCTVLHT